MKCSRLLILALIASLTIGGCPTTSSVDQTPSSEDSASLDENAGLSAGGSDGASSNGSSTDNGDTPVSSGQPDQNSDSDGNSSSGADSSGNDGGDSPDANDNDGDNSAPGEVPPDDGGDQDTPPDDTPAALAGLFAGSLDRVITQSQNGTDIVSNKSILASIAFLDTGEPVEYVIPGHVNLPDLTLSLREVGETTTIEGDYSNGGASGHFTATCTLTAADYRDTQTDLTVQITLTATSGPLTQNMSAEYRLSALLAEPALTYIANTSYIGRWKSGGLSFDVAEDFADNGALTRQ